MLEQLLTDFRPTRVLCAGTRAAELAEALRARSVSAQLVPELADQNAAGAAASPRCDLGICLGLIDPLAEAVDAEAAERTIAILCQHCDTVLFAALTEPAELPESDLRPRSYWVTQFARWSFYRDVDYDAAALAPGALCLRRLAGSPIPVLASYERLLVHKERELVAQRVVSQEYRDTVFERDLEIEALQKKAELGVMVRDLMAVGTRLAPEGTTRARYFNTALYGASRASRVALRGLELGARLVRGSKALLRRSV